MTTCPAMSFEILRRVARCGLLHPSVTATTQPTLLPPEDLLAPSPLLPDLLRCSAGKECTRRAGSSGRQHFGCG